VTKIILSVSYKKSIKFSQILLSQTTRC